MVPSVRHFENLTLWIPLHLGFYAIVHEKPRMDIRESWHNCPLQYFRSFDRGIGILSVFMAPDLVVLPASRYKSHWKLLTCFLGAGGPWPVISRTQAWKWRNLSVRFRRQCFINPWIQTASFLIIVIATTSAAVIWQFAGQGWILPIPLRLIISIFRLYPTTVNKVWHLQCGQIF